MNKGLIKEEGKIAGKRRYRNFYVDKFVEDKLAEHVSIYASKISAVPCFSNSASALNHDNRQDLILVGTLPPGATWSI